MLKHAFCSVTLTLALVSLAPACFAVPIASVPNPKRANGGWVTDMAGMLTPETEKELNRRITALEAKNSSEIAVVTVPDVSPAASPKAFATELFNTWGIGKRGQDNGVLVLVSKGDRRVEVITGKGLTALLPTSQVSTILKQEVTPRFKQRQFDAGVLAGTKALIAQVSRYQRPRTSQGNQAKATVPPLSAQTVATSDSFDSLPMAIMVGLGAGTASVGGMLLYRQLKSRQPAARSNSSSNSDWNSTDYSGSGSSDFSSSNSDSGDYSSSSDSSSSSDFGGGSSSDSGSGDSW